MVWFYWHYMSESSKYTPTGGGGELWWQRGVSDKSQVLLCFCAVPYDFLLRLFCLIHGFTNYLCFSVFLAALFHWFCLVLLVMCCMSVYDLVCFVCLNDLCTGVYWFVYWCVLMCALVCVAVCTELCTGLCTVGYWLVYWWVLICVLVCTDVCTSVYCCMYWIVYWFVHCWVLTCVLMGNALCTGVYWCVH